jgi:hypothetical protein
MSIDFEKREGLRLLSGLENGNLTSADAFNVADQRDPVIVYFILRYLREKYPATQPAGAGVARRLVELTTTYDGVVAKAKQGEKDSIREWFDDTYSLREFFDKPEELMDLIVEKIEG